MKKNILYGLTLILVSLGFLFTFAAFQPTDWRIERSVVIEAPRAEVWAIVSDLNRYNEWNSFYLEDPQAKTQAIGPAATVGSSYSWDGEKSGAGKMTIVSVAEGDQVDFRLDFLRPMVVTNSASFIVSDLERSTKMSWVMSGKHEGLSGLIARAIHLIVSMDAMLGETFETGLNRLKAICENKA